MQNHKYCSIDESGDMGKSQKSTKYFVLSCFLYDDQNLNRKIKKLAGKIHKKNNLELFHARDNTDIVKNKLVRFLNTVNWSGFVLVIKKENFTSYLESLQLLLGQISVTENIFLSLPISKKQEVLTIKNLNKKIILASPKNEPSIQIADFLAWSVFKKFETGDDLYFKLVKERVKIFELKKTAKQNPYIH